MGISRSVRLSRIVKTPDNFVKCALFICSSLTVFFVFLVIVFILSSSVQALKELGFKNVFFSTKWSPNVSAPLKGNYGILAFLNGTILTTIGALILGAPLGVGTAVFIDEYAPVWLKGLVFRGVEIIAGIPSVVIGWFGLTLLVPMIAEITNTSGYGMFAASLVLALMVVPTITTLSFEALQAVPEDIHDASVALGATRWQTVSRVLLPASLRGIAAAVILGMCRAIGETMAVQMVIGNARQLTFNPLTRTSTLTTRIVTDMGESHGVFRSALFAQGLVLLIFSAVLIIIVRAALKGRALSQ